MKSLKQIFAQPLSSLSLKRTSGREKMPGSESPHPSHTDY